MLWPEEMPLDTVICLSGADRLVPTDLVLLHLKAARSSAKVCRSLHWRWHTIPSLKVEHTCIILECPVRDGVISVFRSFL